MFPIRPAAEDDMIASLPMIMIMPDVVPDPLPGPC